MSSRPCSMATMFAWKAVGLWFSLRVTCITGHTSRQNLWPEEKQLYPLSRQVSTKSRCGCPFEPTSGAGSSAIAALPFRNGDVGHIPGTCRSLCRPFPRVDWLVSVWVRPCDVNGFSSTFEVIGTTGENHGHEVTAQLHRGRVRRRREDR